MKKVLFLLMLFTVFSCGSRKVAKSETEAKIKVVLDGQSETTLDSHSNLAKTISVNNQGVSTETTETIEPIDPTKEAFYVDSGGNKQTLVNSRRTTKQTAINNNEKTAVTIAETTDVKIDSNNTTHEKSDTVIDQTNRQVERESYSFWNWWFLLVIPILIAIFVFLKNKLKI